MALKLILFTQGWHVEFTFFKCDMLLFTTFSMAFSKKNKKKKKLKKTTYHLKSWSVVEINLMCCLMCVYDGYFTEAWIIWPSDVFTVIHVYSSNIIAEC